jgi:GTP-binding protein
VTAAKPKIADYHFTTLSPNLGVCKTSDNRSFVIADLPGLIEGASQGLGLGDKFLRHIERCKVIVHIVDMGATEGRNPYDDFVLINKELESFSNKLIKKPMIVLANKMDMPDAEDNLKAFKKKVDCEVYPISAITGKDLDKVLIKIADLIDQDNNEEIYEEDEMLSHVLYKFEKEKPYTIEKEGDYFVIRGDEVERLFRMTKFESDESVLRFARLIRKMGIDDDLEKLGAKEGDIVKILDFSFEYRK